MTTYYHIAASPKHSEVQLYSHRTGAWRPINVCDGEGENYATKTDAENDLEAAHKAWGEYADLANIRIVDVTSDDMDEP